MLHKIFLQDNCKSVFQKDQQDTENDGVGNACDNCPDARNPKQLNNDNDANGDACDPDDDNDGERELKMMYEFMRGCPMNFCNIRVLYTQNC